VQIPGAKSPGRRGVAKVEDKWCADPDLHSPRDGKMGSTKNIFNKKYFVCSKVFKLFRPIRENSTNNTDHN
jgi:hypothetical protein